MLDGVQGAVYRQCQGATNRVDITVGGDADTYYPVVIESNSDHYPATLLNITRAYNETAPNSWNTSTHKGGLTLCILWNSSKYWDGNGVGNANVVNVIQFYETYSTMVGGIDSSTSGLVIWLRGGTAAYHIYSNRGTSLSATVQLNGFTDIASKTYSPKTIPSSIDSYRNIYTNAASATKLQTARTISLSGDVTGSASFDGSQNITINTTVGNATTADISNYLFLNPNNGTHASQNDAVPANGRFAIYDVNAATTAGGNDGYIMAFRWTSGNFVTQVFLDADNTGIMALRHRSDSNVWTDWSRILHSSNIGSYALTPSNYASTLDSRYMQDGANLGGKAYLRYVGINGSQYNFLTNVANSTDPFMVYAPTTAGTSGYILQSTGGIPQ